MLNKQSQGSNKTFVSALAKIFGFITLIVMSQTYMSYIYVIYVICLQTLLTVFL